MVINKNVETLIINRDGKHDVTFLINSCFRDDVYIRSSHGTLVVFLQNDAGFEKWGPTPERLTELAMSFQAAKRVNNVTGNACATVAAHS